MFAKDQSKIIESPYKRHLIKIAQLSNYQPLASIIKQSNDFNYTYNQDQQLVKKFQLQNPQQKIRASIKGSQNSHRKKKQQLAHDRYREGKVKLPKIGRKSSNGNDLAEPRTCVKTLDDNQQSLQEGIKINKLHGQQHKFITVDTRIQTRIDTQQNELAKRLGIANQLVRSQKMLSMEHYPQTQNLKKSKFIEEKLQIQQQDDQQEDEYDHQATPGPGYYSISSSFNNTNQKINYASFGGKSPRFRPRYQSNQPSPSLGIMSSDFDFKNKYKKRTKKLIPFNSKVPKDYVSADQRVQKPGPQQYHPRMGIEEDIIKKIQRNFKGSFGVCEKRFRTLRQNDPLGPGYYIWQKNNQQDLIQGSHYFSSKKDRFA